MSESKNSKRLRRQFSPEDKAAILRRHLVDHVPVSDLCDEYHIQPTLFYLWQRQALEHLSAALQDGRTTRGQQQSAAAERSRLAALEAKLAKKDAIIADIAAEHLALKKNGSSGISGERRADLQEEVRVVAKAVCHPLEHFDLVVHAFEHAGVQGEPAVGKDPG